MAIDHYLIKIVLFLVLIGIIISENSFKLKNRALEIVWLLSLFFWTISFKWVSIFQNHSLNGDEDFNLATAMAISKGGLKLYSDTESLTTGPLHVLAFTIPQYLGMSFSYSSVRFVWFTVLVVSLFLMYLSLKNVFSPNLAKLAFIYPFLLFSTSIYYSFSFFANSWVSILLLIGAFYIWSFNLRKRNHRDVFDFMAVLLLSLSVYAKLQGAFVALSLVGFICYFRYKRVGIDFTYFIKVAASGLIFSILFTAYLLANYSLDDFYFYYLKVNSAYGTESSLFRKFLNVFVVRSTSETYINYYFKHLYLVTFLSYLLISVYRKKWSFLDSIIMIISLLSIISIALPGMTFDHYFSYLLLSFPLLIAGLLIRVKALVYFAVISLSTLFSFISIKYHYQTFNFVKEELLKDAFQPITQSDLSRELKALSIEYKLNKPRLLIIDWRPEVHLETEYVQATHSNIPIRIFGDQLNDLAILGEYRERFLKDLERSNPEVVVIGRTTKYSYHDMTLPRVKSIPKIWDFIESTYTLSKTREEEYFYIRNDIL